MEWKLVLSTFMLIFLAELGDKTQLAAFAASAGARSPWAVFAGAASALVLSSLLAVLFGSSIQRLIPQHYLKLAAGVLFLAFGVLLIVGARRKEPAVVPPGSEAQRGVLTRLVLSTATAFEESSAADYNAMALHEKDPGLKQLLAALAAEERQHLTALRNTIRAHGQVAWSSDQVPDEQSLRPMLVASGDASRRVVDRAIAHELATAGFYAELAKAAPLPALKALFSRLADEEQVHARRLTAAVRQ